MDLQTYRKIKKERLAEQTAQQGRARRICRGCRKVPETCFCARIRPFESAPEFVILIHPKENRKRIGTGRMTHLCIRNSKLFEGVGFDDHAEVNAILNDPSRWPVVLYPGSEALDISSGGAEKLDALVPAGKKLVVFILDGSWPCAKKMLRVSRNLKRLPCLQFTPPHRSIYRIRRQPAEFCFSSVEAVHFLIEQLSASRRWNNGDGHGNLLEVFRFLIDRQVSHLATPGQKAVRGVRFKV